MVQVPYICVPSKSLVLIYNVNNKSQILNEKVRPVFYLLYYDVLIKH